MASIPTRPDAERLLWRLDADDARRPHLFVLSRTRPDWNHLIEQAGWPDADGEHAAIRDYEPLLARLAVGQEFGFRLTANPVQNVARPVGPSPQQKDIIAARAIGEKSTGGRSFRIGHRTASTQLEWLLKRAARWGFTIPESPGPDSGVLSLGESVSRRDDHPDGANAAQTAGHAREVRIISRDRREFGKGPQAKNPVVLRTATFEGLLRVTDPDLLVDRLLNGIGPGKAYGCGLLTLAPVPAGATEPSGGLRG